MTKRVCIDCPNLTTKTRCSDCERKRQKDLGSRQTRGYDAEYERQLRTPEYVNATHCTECGEAFTEDNPKTGGHSVALRRGGRGSKIVPHCRRCNYGWQRSNL